VLLRISRVAAQGRLDHVPPKPPTASAEINPGGSDVSS
jgi:hypothetical protein